MLRTGKCPDCGAEIELPPLQVVEGRGAHTADLFCDNCHWFGTDETFKTKRSLLVWSGGPGGEDLNEAQTRALIVEYFKYPEWHRWDHIAPYGSTNTEPFTGLRNIAPASASNEKLFGNVLTLTTDALSNGVWEASRRWDPIFPGYQQSGSFGSSFYFSMRMNRSNPAGVDAGEKFQGIGWGDTWTVNTPWDTNYVSDGTMNATVQLRWNYTLSRWEVLVHLNDGNPPDVYACDYQAAFEVDLFLPELALEWVLDGVADTATLNAYLNRRLAKSITNAENPRLLDMRSFSQTGPYIFCTHGSGAGSRISEASWYEGHIYQPLPLPPTS